MAGDLNVAERAVLEPTAGAEAVLAHDRPGQTVHKYGRISILAVPNEAVADERPGVADTEAAIHGRFQVARSW